jgi:putative flavoprotein involved in K+ transport
MGKIRGACGSALNIAPDLPENLASGDAAYAGFLDAVDGYIKHEGLDLPEEPSARSRQQDPQCLLNPLSRLDLRSAGISSIIWATGYEFDFSWIKPPVLAPSGEPVHRGGITAIDGLYFLGLPWLSKMNSSFLAGVGADAERLADHIAARST